MTVAHRMPRVRSHAYDKVRPAEHPYAQVKSVGDTTNRPSTSAAATSNHNLNAENNNTTENETLLRSSIRENISDSVDGRPHQVCEMFFHAYGTDKIRSGFDENLCIF